MEKIYVVNKDNYVIDQKHRKEVHDERLPHRSVMFFVKDEEGNILVTKRSDNKRYYPGFWSIVLGGHVKAGDSYEESLKKESEEEIGGIEEYKFIGSFVKDIEEETEFVRLYEVIVDPRKIELCEDEFELGEFWDIEKIKKEIEKRDFLPETEIVLQYLF